MTSYWPALPWIVCSTTHIAVVMDGDTYRNPPAAKRARPGGGKAPG